MALFMGVLRRWKKTLPAMTALPFSTAFHAANIASAPDQKEENRIKKIRKKRFFQKLF